MSTQLILGASIRLARALEGRSGGEAPKEDDEKEGGDRKDATKPAAAAAAKSDGGADAVPVSHEPCTKPDYVDQKNVRYNAAATLLLDDDDDAVMMEWERPIMEAHASILTGGGTRGKRVLNVGFGLGIVDGALQEHGPSLHVIIEAHPTVYKKMVDDGWTEREGVRVCYGRWQDELPKLIEEGVEFDGIFYDTYGEHFTDLEDFHGLVSRCLSRPDGIYSFL